jgi:hypothetical protein
MLCALESNDLDDKDSHKKNSHQLVLAVDRTVSQLLIA